MRQLLTPLIVAASFVGGSHAAKADEALTAELFAMTCIDRLPTFSGIVMPAQTRGLKPVGDGTFEGGDYAIDPRARLTNGSRACVQTGLAEDLRATARALRGELSDRRISVRNVKRRGDSFIIRFNVKGRRTIISISPIDVTGTRLLVYQPNN